ncbi:GTPase HflX [Ruminococcaceae bacterium OttesenSCG-928-I18]|nr:GTPase HflX [Ruminococcaceae bacterium OttesenSCG-928-I18]
MQESDRPVTQAEPPLADAPERVILLGIDTGAYDAQSSMEELSALALANHMEPAAEMLQRRKAPDSATVLGTGRLEEAKDLCDHLQIQSAVYDGELTGSQLRNLSTALGLPVIDRTMLILEIFKNRAVTREGKTQTELATLEYRLPRLAGLGAEMSRQGGGGGGGAGARRGGGETKLEYDRRYIRNRIAALKKRLATMQARRDENRRSREKNATALVALVGYTNVGKSSLMNALTGSEIASDDRLFVTLDPTARRLTLPDGQSVILIDTVGFVSRLPHNLIEAFQSTLEEAAYADLLLKVCDASDAKAEEQLAVTNEVLHSLGAGAKQLLVYNKSDLVPGFKPLDPSALLVSAHTGEGLEELKQRMTQLLAHRVRHFSICLPYDKLTLGDTVRRFGAVEEEQFGPEGVYLRGTIEASHAHLIAPYRCEPPGDKAPE